MFGFSQKLAKKKKTLKFGQWNAFCQTLLFKAKIDLYSACINMPYWQKMA